MPEGVVPGVTARVISVAVLAMGGEGGGVLADWLVGMAEAGGYVAQSTSVPGVAQRTGATIYYVEMFPDTGRAPVLALSPVPGDVDVVVASELMEAARAVQRGLVTPERTVLVASTHRVYSMTERTAMADGRADAGALLETCRGAAKRLVAADMRALAEGAGSVISASLFGALAGSGALPFPREAFEGAIRAGGVGVERSLAAFAAGFAAAGEARAVAAAAAVSPVAAEIVAEGVRRLTDYQDAAYADLYRRRLAGLGGEVLEEVARHLALWMSFEDPIRVAQLKIRASRFERVRAEVRAAPGQIVRIREWMHPRVEEVAETLPGWLGRAALWGPVRGALGRATRRGRRVETTAVGGFLLLAAVAGLRRWRRGTARFRREDAAIEAWLEVVRRSPLGVEVARLQGLVKGYSDTHARGWGNFHRIMAVVPGLEGRADGGAVLAGLREAALADDTGAKLGAALAEVG